MGSDGWPRPRPGNRSAAIFWKKFLKILLITVTLCAGGAEVFVLRLARKLTQLGHDCAVLNLNSDLEDKRLVGLFSDLTIHRIRLPWIRWIKRLDRVLILLGVDFSVQHALTRFLFRRRYVGAYQVYHSHLFPADYLVCDSGIFDAALVSTFHGDYIHYADEVHRPSILKFSKKVERVLECMNGLVYISDHQKEMLARQVRVPLGKFHKIYNGFELPRHTQGKLVEQFPGRITFIMVARGLKEKGWATAIKAFGEIKGDARLILVGESQYLGELRDAHPNTRIEFAGFHATPTDLIASAQVFLFPSIIRSESLPTVIVEALCCGVPVISTEVGEVKRMITTPDGELAGQLVPLDDEEELVAAFAAAMQRYVDDPGLRTEHSRSAARAFEQFEMGRCAAKYLDVYEAALPPSRLR